MKKLIVGKNVKLRALETEDLPKLKELRNRKEVRIHVREYRILGMINQKEWFNSLFKENPPKAIMFAVLNMKNSLIGICGLTYIDWKNRNAEISILLSLKNWQKRKESKDTISLLIKYGFDELNLHRLWVEIYNIAPENIKLFKKMKFSKEGVLRHRLWRDGKWHNSFIFAKLAD